MSIPVNIYDAKTQLSKLIERAQAGEDIVIARAGKPVVRLVPIPNEAPRRPGAMQGLRAPDDFFDPIDDDELAGWT